MYYPKKKTSASAVVYSYKYPKNKSGYAKINTWGGSNFKGWKPRSTYKTPYVSLRRKAYTSKHRTRANFYSTDNLVTGKRVLRSPVTPVRNIKQSMRRTPPSGNFIRNRNLLKRKLAQTPTRDQMLSSEDERVRRIFRRDTLTNLNPVQLLFGKKDES